MTNQMGYAKNLAEDTGKSYSRNVWKGCPIKDIRDGYRDGIVFEDRFTKGPTLAAGAVTVVGNGYRSRTGSGNTVALADAVGGGIVMTTGAGNTECQIATLGTPFQISAGLGDFWLEARVELDSIADNEPGWFIGLCDSTVFSAIIPIAADGTMADLNFCGFHRSEADGDKLDTIYRADNAGSTVNSTKTVKADAVTLEAATAVKLGMHFDTDDNVLTFFKNGVALADTKVIPDATGTDFPADVRLGLVIAGLSGSGGSGTNTVSWIRAAQLT